jgi:lipoprotein-anchoring transpeptidase ErfK/SrfK
MTDARDARPSDAPAPPAARPAAPSSGRRAPRWPRATLAIGSIAIAGAGLLASTELHGIPALHATPQAGDGQRGLPFGLADEPVPGVVLTSATPAAEAGPARPGTSAVVAAAARGSPESRLIGIYRAIGAGRLDAATDAAAALTHDVPGFRLAQLVYADLLSVRVGHAPGFAAGTLPAGALAAAGPGAAASIASGLSELHEEAVQRLRALQERPPADKLPAELVLLPKSVHHAVVVDTARSRLYLYENGPQGLRLAADTYVSVGKQGVDKTVEGDQRTPLGVYFVSDRMGGGALEQRFGAGALELNYPNFFDRLHGRTGKGIYVHGVPQDTYSRPPQDSDGCVVLANDDLLALMSTIPVHDTPVVITRGVHWIAPADAQRRREAILEAVTRWQGARAVDDEARLDAFYAPGTAPAAASAPPPTLVLRGRTVPNPAAHHAPRVFEDLSVLAWSDDQDTMVVTFRERTPHLRGSAVRQQYWERERSQWRIVAEGPVR